MLATRSARVLVSVAAVATTVWLTGCSTASLFDSETLPPTSYLLTAVPPAASVTESLASKVDVAIARPDVGPGLDTRRIAVLRGRQLDYYRGSEWGGSVIEIVQTLLVTSLDDQKLFRSVTSEQTRVSSEYLLDVEVRDFQAEYHNGGTIPNVRVTMVGRLIRIADREMIASVAATALQPATDNRMGEVAAAFEKAAQQVALEIAGKASQAINDDQKMPSSPARTTG